MSFRSRFVAIWKDPVGSNLIAGTIVAGAGFLYLELTRRIPQSSLLAHPLARVGIPALALVVCLQVWIHFGRRRKILLFLSAGATCRDAMAKAITTQLLDSMKPRPRIEIRAAGLGPIMSDKASYGARHAIRELYGKDLLDNHRPELLTPGLAERADLILVMDRSLLLTPGKTLPAGKTFLLKEYFGSGGDVVDPWPDGKDSATLTRYRERAEELRALLTSNIKQIVKTLEI